MLDRARTGHDVDDDTYCFLHALFRGCGDGGARCKFRIQCSLITDILYNARFMFLFFFFEQSLTLINGPKRSELNFYFLNECRSEIR